MLNSFIEHAMLSPSHSFRWPTVLSLIQMDPSNSFISLPWFLSTAKLDNS